MKIFFICSVCLLLGIGSMAQAPIDRGTQFLQEYREDYPTDSAAAQKNIRSIAVDKNQTIYIATEAGFFTKTALSSQWTAIPFSTAEEGPAYRILEDLQGTIWLANWKGVFRLEKGLPKFIPGTRGPITVLCMRNESLVAIGPSGCWIKEANEFKEQKFPIARSVRMAVEDQQHGLWIASDLGLYYINGQHTTHFYKTNTLISAGLKGLAMVKGKLWVAGLGGISILSAGKRIGKLGTAAGLPSIYANCVQVSQTGVTWVGTRQGLVRFYADGTHSLLFGRRWLLDNQVNDIAFDKMGNAWIATANGVTVIKSRSMNLEQKQDYYYNILMRRHMREPWIAGQCRLLAAGDTSHWQAEDDDNDGEYTGNYLAMESFRYATTKLPEAREKAKKAFHFLKLLKDVTGGDGYFARTIVPLEWGDKVHDGNRIFSERERAEELVKEPRFKPVENRWRKSADGKWLWKGDASSDEWCGHMMGYYFYYTLAADEAEQTLIRNHVASLVDHLMAHDFTMMDIDGTHTRWSVWSPTLLNQDPEWNPDRCQNSMELLAFLKLAYFLTRDQKYQDCYIRLIKKEHYLENAAGILNQNPAWFIYFDVTLQAYLFPILIQCETDPVLLSFYRQLMDKWMLQRKKDHNPLINYLYCYCRQKKIEGQQSITFLKDTPLDLVDWPVDHTNREDIRLVHTPVLDDLEISELPPAYIRGTVRWDDNPWRAVAGNPTNEKEPVFWLYPYWLGRYLKMIPSLQNY